MQLKFFITTQQVVKYLNNYHHWSSLLSLLNSGANGEYAGLLAIKLFHEANDQSQRRICLIPVSAHGTNPASASMVNFKVSTFRFEFTCKNSILAFIFHDSWSIVSRLMTWWLLIEAETLHDKTFNWELVNRPLR